MTGNSVRLTVWWAPRRVIALTAMCGALSVPGVADAAEKARFRKQEATVQGVSEDAIKKLTPPPPPKDRKKDGPTITLEDFVGERQKKIQNINDQLIERMIRLIKVTPDDDAQKPQFHFMLAELYAEKQRYYDFQARGLDQKIFEARGPQKAQLERDQKTNEKQSEQWLLKAVEQYISASNYRKYEKMDEVLFKLAYLLQTVKREDQARDFFHRLIKDYPNSKYIPNAYLSFAEYFFAKQEFDNALKFYERVEQFPKSSVYGFAVYKKGWVYINQAEFKRALETFVSVVRMCQDGKISDKQQKAALEREAKKDIVKAYARTPNAGPDKAWEFFVRVGGDFAPKMMEALAEIYWEQGMFGDSSKVYRKLIVLNAESPRICEWQGKVVRNTLSQGTKRDQVQEVRRWGVAFDRVSAMQGAKKNVVEECRNSFRDDTKLLAMIWHKEAQKTKNPDTYQLVRFIYKDYLDRFPKEKDSAEVGFYYAESLFTTEAWKEAAEQYTKVIEMDPKGKFAQESALASVYAWQNALNIDDAAARDRPNDKDLKPKPLPEFQKKMLTAYDTYLKYVPAAPELPKIRYRKARIYYEYNQFDKAIPLFQDVVEKHPDDELAIISANLLTDSLVALGRSDEVIMWADKFLEMPQLMKDEEFQRQMMSLKTESLALAGDAEGKRGNHKDCGLSLLQAAESARQHPKRALWLFRAGECFTDARLIGRAIAAREILIKDHPKDPLAQRALFQIASGFHQIASYKSAADYYEQFANKYPGEKEASTALGNAYAFRIGLGEFEQAVADMNNYIKFYGAKKPQDVADKVFQMSEVYERQQKNEELARHLKEYLSKWGSKGGLDKQMIAHFKLGEIAWKKSCPQADVNGACIKLERVTASGRQKALYELNKKIKDKRKRIKEIRTQCGPPTKAKITVFDRSKKLVGEAQAHFATALKLWAKGDALKKLSAERQGFAVYAAAGSAFYQAEQTYEDFLRVKFPEGLDFQAPSNYDSPKKAAAKKKKQAESTKRFMAYLDQKGKLAERLSGPTEEKKGAYNRVVDLKSAHWMIAASARVGQVYSNFVDQLYTAEIPKDLKETDEWGLRPREIFCDALVDQAEPIETKAVQAYGLCLKAATQQSWFNDWSTMCEVELNQMQPSEYPLAAEAKPEPGYVPTLMTPASVVADLPTRVVPTSGKQ